MKEFLKKINLIDHLTTELPISKISFADRLHAIVDEGSMGFFSNPFEAFSSSKNEFKGNVNYDGFTIKRRRKFFDTSANFAIATGTFSEQNGKLFVETEINGFGKFFILFYIIIILSYSAISLSILLNSNNNEEPFFVLPFLLLHALLMCGIPYFLMRRSVKRLKYELVSLLL